MVSYLERRSCRAHRAVSGPSGKAWQVRTWHAQRPTTRSRAATRPAHAQELPTPALGAASLLACPGAQRLLAQIMLAVRSRPGLQGPRAVFCYFGGSTGAPDVPLQVRCVGTQSLDILAAFRSKNVPGCLPGSSRGWPLLVAGGKTSSWGVQTSSPCALMVRVLALSGMWGDVAGWVVGTRTGRRPHHGGLSVRCGKWAPTSCPG